MPILITMLDIEILRAVLSHLTDQELGRHALRTWSAGIRLNHEARQWLEQHRRAWADQMADRSLEAWLCVPGASS